MIALSKKNGNLDQDDFDEGVDDEVESDSDSGLGGSVPPCSVTFVGANVQTGKSSLRSKSKDIKVRPDVPNKDRSRMYIIKK